MAICFWLLRHLLASALAFDRASAGSNRLARIAMIAMTTSNSIRVKALLSAPAVLPLLFSIMACFLSTSASGKQQESGGREDARQSGSYLNRRMDRMAAAKAAK